MGFCPKCGCFDNNEYKFCPKCGLDLQKITNQQRIHTDTSARYTKNNCNLRPVLDISKLELEIHDLTNIERQKRGLSLLVFDPEIRDICRRHSKDMSVRNYFDHINPDGREPMDRAKAANFDFEKNLYDQYKIDSTIKKINPFQKPYSSCSAYGENIFQTNLANSIQTINGVHTHYNWQTLDQIAKTVIDGWMKSKDHYDNIVLPTWQSEGLGVFVARDDKVFVTQNFHYFISS